MATVEARMTRLRKLGRLLDRAVTVPGTNIGVGVDGLVGLIPGVGDAIGAVLSSYIILEGARLGASRGTLVRMVWNVIIDAIVGAVPLLGDVFDIGWKANLRNIALLEAHAIDPERVRASSRRFAAALLTGLAAILIGAAALATWLFTLVLHAMRA